jgi:hypothetical protein
VHGARRLDREHARHDEGDAQHHYPGEGLFEEESGDDGGGQHGGASNAPIAPQIPYVTPIGMPARNTMVSNTNAPT